MNLRHFFDHLGIDYQQWLTLTRIAIKRDFRESSMSSTLRPRKKGQDTFFILILFYLLTGIFFALVVIANSDVFFTGTLLVSYTMIMVSGLILIEYHSIVISPDDHAVLGYMPINSRTYFAVRVSNLLFYLFIFCTIMGLPAAIAYMFILGFKPWLGLVALLSVYLANFMVSSFIIILYTLILKKVRLKRLQNILAYFQLFFSFMIYGGYFFLPRLLTKSDLVAYKLSDSPILFFIPSTWYSRYLKIVLGQGSFTDIILAGISLVSALVLGYIGLSRISMEYSEKLSYLASLPAEKKPAPKSTGPGLWDFMHGYEERAISKLIWNQFRFDNKFKLAVLSILPLAIFYLMLGIEEGPLADPFVSTQLYPGRSSFLYFAILLFPILLRTYVTRSDHYQAAWVFFTTPVDVSRLVRAQKSFLMLYFVLPFLLILGLIFSYFFDNISHALLHILVLSIISHIFLQLAFLLSPELPFSKPNIKG
ncbi:MAG: hypothetical protein D6813_03630, partial [Calditrichaeota bacterium]